MLKQPTVLITGCTDGGIGHSLALSFAAQNYQVFATSRKIASMSSLSDVPNITLLPLDVTSPASIQAVYSTVSAITGGTLDILYHNAGVRSIAMSIHSSWELTEKTFQANFFSVVELNRVFMPMILKAQGKVIVSNSVAAVVPIPTQVIYNASKAALDMYLRVLDEEIRPLGVKVVNVVTGEVGTRMAEIKMEELPQGSPYTTIESTINTTWKTRKYVMPVGEYANKIVQIVGKPSPPSRVWLGANSTMVWFVEKLGIQWIYGPMFRKEYGLDKLTIQN